MSNPISVLHCGDIGDIIYSLPMFRDMKVDYLVSNRDYCKPIASEPRYSSVKSLVEVQPYINRFAIHDGEPITYDLTTFRKGGHPWGKTLLDMQAKWLSLPYDPKPWLTVTPRKGLESRVIINATPRYVPSYFRWHDIIKFYGKELLFVGLPDEHVQFENNHSVKVEYLPTKNLLDVAEVIAGSHLFIGNQSSPMSIAIGLGHPFIQAVYPFIPDCIYPRSNGQYVTDGAMVLRSADGREQTFGVKCFQGSLNKALVPPGGWYVTIDGQKITGFAFNHLLKAVNAFQVANDNPKLKEEDLVGMVLEQRPELGVERWMDSVRISLNVTNKLIRTINHE